jgi:hypothetical protein
MPGSQRPRTDDFTGTQWLIRESSRNSCAEFRQAQGGILQSVSSGTFLHKVSVPGHPHLKLRELIPKRRYRIQPHCHLLAHHERRVNCRCYRKNVRRPTLSKFICRMGGTEI